MYIKKYKNGLEVEHSVFVVSSSGDDWYKVQIPFGVFTYVFYAQGNYEADALDTVADFLEDNDMTGLYHTYEEVWEAADSTGIPFEDYEEQYIIAGNHGLYLTELIIIEKL